MPKTSKQEAIKDVAEFSSLSGNEHEQHIRESIQELQDVQTEVSALIIADAPLTSFEVMTEALGMLAGREVLIQQAETALNEFFNLRGVDAQLPWTYPGLPPSTSCASDIAHTMAYQWDDVGYKLGLAVGMQLGPHAFDEKIVGKKGK